MNLINETVIHKLFGEGKILSSNDNCIVVLFHDGEKKFVYPDSFEKFLKAKNSKIDHEIRIELNKTKEKQREEKRLKEQIEMALNLSHKKRTYSRSKKYSRANIAFKCTFCDGGQNTQQVGFNGVCSDAIIHNNIEVEKRTWCSSDNSACLKYLKGDITRKELDDMRLGQGFVCYESNMLREWKVFAGSVQSGQRKNAPIKLPKVQQNSLCVLTTREPQSSEKDRYIFGVFLVDEKYVGNISGEGYVNTGSKYKIKLSSSEAHKLLFWNYHANESRSHVATWSSGIYRYFDDHEAVQILSDIAQLKKETDDEVLAQEFLEYFIKCNHINISEVPEKNGAILRAL